MSGKSFFYISTCVALVLMTIYLFIDRFQRKDNVAVGNTSTSSILDSSSYPSDWRIVLYNGMSEFSKPSSSGRTILSVIRSDRDSSYSISLGIQSSVCIIQFDASDPLVVHLAGDMSGRYIPDLFIIYFLYKLHESSSMKIVSLDGQTVDEFDVSAFRKLVYLPVRDRRHNEYEVMMQAEYSRNQLNYKSKCLEELRIRNEIDDRKFEIENNRREEALERDRIELRKMEIERDRREKEMVVLRNREADRRRREEEMRKNRELEELERVRRAQEIERLRLEEDRKEREVVSKYQVELNRLLKSANDVGLVTYDNWEYVHKLVNDIDTFLDGNIYNLADLELLRRKSNDLAIYKDKKIEVFDFDGKQYVGYLEEVGYKCTIHIMYNGKVMGSVEGKISYIKGRRLAKIEDCFSKK